MVSPELEKAAIELKAVRDDLVSTHMDIKTKGPQNDFARPGFSKYTSFAQNCRLRFKPFVRHRKISIGAVPFTEFSAFNNMSGASLLETDSTFLEEIELWNGFKGSYSTASAFMLEELKSHLTSFEHNQSTEIVKIQRMLHIEPRDLLLVQLCSKLRGSADNNLLLMREHFRYPDDKTSIVHQISMFPLKLMLTPRDILVLTTFRQDQAGVIYFASESLNLLLPESKGCVRGTLRHFGLKIDPCAYSVEEKTLLGSNVSLVLDLDPSVWIPRFSLKEYLEEAMGNYLSMCETVITQLKRTPERYYRLNSDFLKGVSSQILRTNPVNLPVESQVVKEKTSESLDELKKLEKQLDEELALLSSSGEEDNDSYDEESSVSDVSFSSVDSKERKSKDRKVRFSSSRKKKGRSVPSDEDSISLGGDLELDSEYYSYDSYFYSDDSNY